MPSKAANALILLAKTDYVPDFEIYEITRVLLAAIECRKTTVALFCFLPEAFDYWAWLSRLSNFSLPIQWKNCAQSKPIGLKLLKTWVWLVASYEEESKTLKKDDIKKIKALYMYRFRTLLRVQ